MSADKKNDLLDHPTQGNGTKKGKNGLPHIPGEDEDFKTKELSLEEITRRIEEEKARTVSRNNGDGNGDKAESPAAQSTVAFENVAPPPPGLSQQPPSQPDQAAPPDPAQPAATRATEVIVPADVENIPDPGDIPDTAADNEDDEPIKITEEEYTDMPMERLTDMVAGSTMEPRKSYAGLSRMLLFVAVVVVGITIFMVLKQPKTTTPGTDPVNEEQKPAETTGTQAPEMVTEKIQPPDATTTNASSEAESLPVYRLEEDEFKGAAPIKVKEEGPVISEKDDPVMAAAADALKVRLGFFKKPKFKKKNGVTTTTLSGKIRKFSVVHTFQEKGGEVLKDDIVIRTPRMGSIVVKKNVLQALKKIDYDGFRKELNKAGLEIIETTMEEEKTVVVQLRTKQMSRAQIKPSYTIGPKSVGPIKLGMNISKLEKALPSSRYGIVDKKILIENKYFKTYKILDKANKPLFFVYEKNDVVWGLQVVSSKYKTSRGLGIGITLADLRFLMIQNETVNITTTQTGVPYTFGKDENMRYFLTHSKLDFKKQSFPANAKVTGILVGGSPYLK